MLELLIKGILVGVAIAAPVGPVGALCVRVTLTRGPLHGLWAGLGAALADAIFGVVAAFGLTQISELLERYQVPIRIAGALFMLLLAIRIWAKQVGDDSPEAQAKALAAETKLKQGGTMFTAFGVTFFLTLTNPVTILAFATIFAAVGVTTASTTFDHAMVMVGGVFIGSCIWWLTLAGGSSFLRGLLKPGAMRHINHVTAGLLLACAIVVILSLIRPDWVPLS
ncbi:MAG: LysE family transporter [Alphaproteobacteria bacterium]|nr:LysE family transporter [Alphaproteobacteria bacterium]